MKKIPILAAITFFLSACASAPPPASPTLTTPADKPAAAVTAVQPQFHDVVTQEALPVTVKSFYPNGDPSGTVVSAYNDKGFLISQQTTNGNGLLVETRAGKPKGDVWRITVTNAQTGEVLSYEDRTYSPEGDLLVQTVLNAKEVPQSSSEYTWVEGKKTQWVAKLGVAGITQAKTYYSYDAAGNLVRVEVLDSGDKPITTYQNQYDEQGRWISRKGFDPSGALIEQTNITWNGAQKLKEETVKPLLRAIEYTYSDTTSAPTGIASSVRGKLVERQVLEYVWIKHTHRVQGKE